MTGNDRRQQERESVHAWGTWEDRRTKIFGHVRVWNTVACIAGKCFITSAMPHRRDCDLLPVDPNSVRRVSSRQLVHQTTTSALFFHQQKDKTFSRRAKPLISKEFPSKWNPTKRGKETFLTAPVATRTSCSRTDAKIRPTTTTTTTTPTPTVVDELSFRPSFISPAYLLTSKRRETEMVSMSFDRFKTNETKRNEKEGKKDVSNEAKEEKVPAVEWREIEHGEKVVALERML